MRRSTSVPAPYELIDPRERLQNELRFTLGIGQLEDSWLFRCVTLVFSASAIIAFALQTVYPLLSMAFAGGIIAHFIDAVCLRHEQRWIAELDRQERVVSMQRTPRRVFHLEELREAKQLVFELCPKRVHTLRIRRLHFCFTIADAAQPIDETDAREILQWVIDGLKERQITNWDTVEEIVFLQQLPRRVVPQGKPQLH